MMIEFRYIILFVLLSIAQVNATTRFSTAGFYELEKTGRKVYNFNNGWKFIKNDASGAEQSNYNDTQWATVSLPHTLEYLPEEGGGNRNYQGVVWYRKTFDYTPSLFNEKIFLYFEAIMGKSKVFVNGKSVCEKFGGFLPLPIDITNYLINGQNIIAVKADNSNDPLYAPGKPQMLMDFSYFGGIYRDCWLITHNAVYISDPNSKTEPANHRGLSIKHEGVSSEKATMQLKLNLCNDSKNNFSGRILFTVKENNGRKVAEKRVVVNLAKGMDDNFITSLSIKSPKLWTPETPYLYDLEVRILDAKNNTIDGYIQKVGVKQIEVRGKDGLYLNGRPYPNKLIGVNRHQDFAIIGNAMSNNLHYRDVKKLRDAGITVVRNAHYPQDPAFMDACDQLGVFVIVNTPGWQFWNNDPIFEKRILSDIRDMVRRDRNHASLFFWEPVLNETHYPESFAVNALKVMFEECPQDYSASDPGSKGSNLFPIIYSHPAQGNSSVSVSEDRRDPNKIYFTREWGDNVDDWANHNATNRVHRSWGEVPMLIQAKHFANPDYLFTSLELLNKTDRQHIGGTLWHSFDHGRGYHPQNFYGGIMDSYRQPKYAYYLFQSQRPPVINPNLSAESGPMIYIAHEMSPFSPTDVTIFSNCDEVRLRVNEKGKTYTWKRSESPLSMPHPMIEFKNVFNFMDLKTLARARKRSEIYILAEGMMDGQVVVRHKVEPALRPSKLRLRIDNEGQPIIANGSDVVVIIAELIDQNGNVKRLNNDYVRFSVNGQGHHIKPETAAVSRLDWGSAPILVQTTTIPGKVQVTASIEQTGTNTAQPVSIEFETQSSEIPLLFKKSTINTLNRLDKSSKSDSIPTNNTNAESQQQMKKLLDQVINQQDYFGEPIENNLKQ